MMDITEALLAELAGKVQSNTNRIWIRDVSAKYLGPTKTHDLAQWATESCNDTPYLCYFGLVYNILIFA